MGNRSVGRRDAALGGLAVIVLAAITGVAAKASVVEGAETGPSADEALAAFRKLSDPQKRAFLTMLEKVHHGQPLHTAGLTFLTECGWDREEAARLISTLPTKPEGGV